MGLSVNAGSVSYLSVSVTAKINDATRQFTMEVSDKDRFLYPGSAILISGDSGGLLLNGYVNKYSAKFDANSHTISVSGRSKSQDSVDSSADHPTGQFKNKTAIEIANELSSKVSNSHSTKLSLPKIPQFHINQGEKIHQVNRRLAAQYGASITGTADGNMEWVTAETASRVGGAISEGMFPLLSASGDLDDTKAFSTFEFRSQLAGREEKYGDEASQGSARSSGSATRNRPYIAVVDKSQDKAQSKVRADWQARQIEARTKKVNIVIQGDTIGGTLVEPNMLVHIASPWLGVNQEMLIETCTYSTDSNGTRTDIALVPPEAYKGKSTSSSKKGASKADDGSPSPFAASDPSNVPVPDTGTAAASGASSVTTTSTPTPIQVEILG